MVDCHAASNAPKWLWSMHDTKQNDPGLGALRTHQASAVTQTEASSSTSLPLRDPCMIQKSFSFFSLFCVL